MEYWSAALEEVALSGLEGCTLEELWCHLAARVPALPALDDATRAFLWRAFLRRGQKEVQCFELPEERSLPTPEGEGEGEKGLSSSPFYRYSPVCDQERGVVGSCATYTTRLDCTTHLKETTPSLLQVEERYGRRLVLVGSQALRESALLMHKSMDPMVATETLWYCVLELVASFRGRGVLRSSVSHGYMGFSDSRKTWHIVKRFKQMGLLVTKVIATQRPSKLKKCRNLTLSEHRVYHVKFAHLIGSESHDLQPVTLEDEEEAEETSSGPDRRSMVGELPLDYQLYKMVESAGARGMSTVELREHGLKLSHKWLSFFAKSVGSMPQYIRTTVDESATKTYRIIAKKHARHNTDIKALLRLGERKSPLIIKKAGPILLTTPVMDEEEGGVSMATEGDETGSVAEEDDDPLLLGDPRALLNIRQCRRKQMVLDFFSENPTLIMDNTRHLKTFIADQERSEGRTKLIDRKTVTRLLNILVKSGDLKTVTLHLQGGVEGVPEDKKEVQLYCLASTNDEVIKEHMETVKEHYTSDKLKTEKQKAEEVPGSSGSEAEEEGEGEELEEGSDNEESPEEQPGMMLTSKFQKLRHLHIYLWLLSNGCSEEEWEQLSSILPDSQYPWVPHVVRQATPLKSGRGSVTIKEVLNRLPLCAVLMLFGMQKYAKRPLSVKNYLKNPEHHGIQFSRLPKRIKETLAHTPKSTSLVSHKTAAMLTHLRDMGLVNMSVHTITSRTKDMATVSLTDEASFLDTTKCAPRHSFFLETARSTFPTVTLPLHSLNDLLHFWFHLNQVCTSTPILIKGADTSVAEGDAHSLPWVKGRKRTVKQAEYESQGFGAGGLPPSLFAHLARNWKTFLKPVAKSGGKAKTSLQQTEEGAKGESPNVAGDSPGGPPLATVMHGGDHVQVVEVPWSVVSKGKGGRGFKRPPHRLNEGERQVKRTKKDVGESGEGAFMPRRKFQWSAAEDTLLLMVRVALRVLQRLKCSEPQGIEMLQTLHNDFGLSESKDLMTVKRRMQTLARNKSIQMSVGALTEELLQDTQLGLSSEGQDVTFTRVLSELQKRQGVVSSSALSPSHSVLPPTVQELHTMYSVIDSQEDLKDTPPVPSTDNMADLNRSLLMDIIYCVLLSDLPYQEMYTAYKVFEAFPESDLQAIFRLLRDRFLLKEKRVYNVGVLTRQGIHETGRYLISSSVQNTLFGNTPPQYGAEMAAILNQLTPRYSGDVPVSDEGAGPSNAVEDVECPPCVSMDTNEIDAARLSVLLNAVVGVVGGGEGGGVYETPVEKIEMSFPSYFFNGYENLVHPIATGNSTEDVMDSEGESDGESEGGDLMKEAGKAAGPLLAGQMQLYIPEHTRINYVNITLSAGNPIGPLLEPTDEEGQDHFVERDEGGVLRDGPLTRLLMQEYTPVTDAVVTGDGPITDAVVTGDGPVTGAVVTGDGPVTGTVVTGDGPVTDAVMTGDGPVTDAAVTGDGSVTGTVVTGDSPVTGTAVTGDSPVTDAAVTGDSPVTDAVVTGDSPVTDAVVTGDGPVTDDALILCAVCNDLGLCEGVATAALYTLQGVRGAGPIGRPLTAVKEDVHLASGLPREHVEDVVQVLLNLGMLHVVGTADQRLVATEHSAPWYTTNRILASSSTRSPFPCRSQFRIWSSLSGTGHINEQMLHGLKDTVCQEVNRRPGVTLAALKEHFCGSLQPAALTDLLRLLVAEDCITAHHTTQHMDTNLFSKPVVEIVSTEDQFSDLSYFEPTLNNSIFLVLSNEANQMQGEF